MLTAEPFGVVLICSHWVPLGQAPEDGSIRPHEVDVHAWEQLLVCVHTNKLVWQVLILNTNRGQTIRADWNSRLSPAAVNCLMSFPLPYQFIIYLLPTVCFGSCVVILYSHKVLTGPRQSQRGQIKWTKSRNKVLIESLNSHWASSETQSAASPRRQNLIFPGSGRALALPLMSCCWCGDAQVSGSGVTLHLLSEKGSEVWPEGDAASCVYNVQRKKNHTISSQQMTFLNCCKVRFICLNVVLTEVTNNTFY